MRPTPRKRVHPFPSNGATPGLGAVIRPTPSPKNVLRPGKTSERVRPRCGHASVGMRRSRAHAAVPLLPLCSRSCTGQKDGGLVGEGNERPLADLSGLAGVLPSPPVSPSNGSAAGLWGRPPACLPSPPSSRAPTPAGQ